MSRLRSPRHLIPLIVLTAALTVILAACSGGNAARPVLGQAAASARRGSPRRWERPCGSRRCSPRRIG